MCMSDLSQRRIKMRIVLIGAGNLATNLGKALVRAGHTILQVYSRTEASAFALANLLDSSYTTVLSEVCKDAELYVMAVKDSVLEQLALQLVCGRERSLFVHTAGSMPMDLIPAERRGVFYPMQTFSKSKKVNFNEIPCFIEAKNQSDEALLRQLAESVSQSVYVLDSENRKYVHLAAVFCCNFANRCFALGEELLAQHGGVPFDVMLPLIDETARKLHELSPKEAQTGPAVRWDENVMNKQKALLSGRPDALHVYELLSQSIHEAYAQKDF